MPSRVCGGAVTSCVALNCGPKLRSLTHSPTPSICSPATACGRWPTTVAASDRPSHLHTYPGDTVLNHYLLEHTWRALADRGYPFSLWSPPFFYPTPHVLGYSETLLGVAPAYWLLRLGLPPEDAYPIWMIAMNG